MSPKNKGVFSLPKNHCLAMIISGYIWISACRAVRLLYSTSSAKALMDNLLALRLPNIFHLFSPFFKQEQAF